MRKAAAPGKAGKPEKPVFVPASGGWARALRLGKKISAYAPGSRRFKVGAIRKLLRAEMVAQLKFAKYVNERAIQESKRRGESWPIKTDGRYEKKAYSRYGEIAAKAKESGKPNLAVAARLERKRFRKRFRKALE